MSPDVLDDVDRGVLYHLQRDARNSTSTEMGERLGVAASTVRNRVNRLEERGVIEGYRTAIDYEKAGFHLHILFACTVQDDVDAVAEAVMEQEGVVAVRELLAGSENLHVEAVGTGTDELTEVADVLRDLGLDIERSMVLKNERRQPFTRFDRGAAGDDG
jgi:DNA-binding Lrp family transcriptional regulator